MPLPPDTQPMGFGRLPLSAFAMLILAGLLCAWSGFFTMDFMLSGIYTWPRFSRVVALICATIILSYEFIYKEHRARHRALTGIVPVKVVWYFCVLPYMAGTVALLVIAF